ncbi:MAG: hypothetical protein ACLFTA_01880 [Candidatus Nanohaloarchaea archaeon]
MDPEGIFEEIDEAEEKIEKLKDQRRKLIEANKTLLNLVERMESRIDVEDDGFEYSFEEGWNSSDIMHGLKIEPNEYSEEELERQIDEIVKTVNNLENH